MSSPSSSLSIREVREKSDWKRFIEFPWQIYKGDPNWVPPLQIAVRDMLDPKKNPFFKHAEYLPLIAERDGKVVGRVVGVIDETHNKFHEEKTVFFGFFECIDDATVSQALLERVRDWGKNRGSQILRGPVNLSTNHECGLLVEGFNDPPAVMMTYNPPYYIGLLEKFGLTKSKDLFAYLLDSTKHGFSDRLAAVAKRLRERGGVTFRTVDMKRFDQELEVILDIYNDAWEKNWGFVPMNPEEFAHMAKDLKAVLDPRLLLIAEVKGKPAAFALALPDVHKVFKKIPDGKLFPTGLLKILWYAKGPGKKIIDRARVLTLGIKKEFRDVGIGAMLYSEYYTTGPALGYPRGEASWILEDNIPMNKALVKMQADRYKVYRIYDLAL